jgi:hypothetical protein
MTRASPTPDRRGSGSTSAGRTSSGNCLKAAVRLDGSRQALPSASPPGSSSPAPATGASAATAVPASARGAPIARPAASLGAPASWPAQFPISRGAGSARPRRSSWRRVAGRRTGSCAGVRRLRVGEASLAPSTMCRGRSSTSYPGRVAPFSGTPVAVFSP